MILRWLLIVILVLTGIGGVALPTVFARHADRFDRPDSSLALPAVPSADRVGDTGFAERMPDAVWVRPVSLDDPPMIGWVRPTRDGFIKGGATTERNWGARAPPRLFASISRS